jgi:hypothetical protein
VVGREDLALDRRRERVALAYRGPLVEESCLVEVLPVEWAYLAYLAYRTVEVALL